ncbi:anti-sigma factor domain-containing protein [Lacinutrix sp. Bg11-31]|uniref:anti-sigma factor n=1 Tax=Lacinutrix sp. Bg11-31 TaxID=2057808 RepID=UPI000C317C17|nr:anti-sigma factor [Lacinutrix sp. Bg11-31]AUC80965.1 anti-sigma factor [Lacinutrix sp. Bg11-31]
MEKEQYIASGILELYVAGSLTEAENKDVYNMMLKHPEVLQEVLDIEAAIIKLTKAAAPKDKVIFNSILNKLKDTDNDTKVVSLNNKPKNSWYNYTGWAAALIFGGGLLWMNTQNNALETQITEIQTEKDFFETQIEDLNSDLVDSKKIINVFRDKDIISVPLAGQAVYPEAYAKAYWNKEDKTVYLDLAGLPEPPEGKVYQIWSLTLNPLTPTSLGTIDDFKSDDNKIFSLENTNESQAFGITLEPAGGSVSPTLEQLYTLGVIES